MDHYNYVYYHFHVQICQCSNQIWRKKSKYLKIGIIEVPTESSTPGHPKLCLIVPICSFRTGSGKYVFINCILSVKIATFQDSTEIQEMFSNSTKKVE